MKEEQVQFAEFSQFCELTLADKARSIGDATDKIETLEVGNGLGCREFGKQNRRCWKQIRGDVPYISIYNHLYSYIHVQYI
jgi:hypothetical protein